MEYRKLPRGTEEIGVIGLGTSSIGAAGEKEAERALDFALENGINYFDLASGDAVPFPALGNNRYTYSGRTYIFKYISGRNTAAERTAGQPT